MKRIRLTVKMLLGYIKGYGKNNPYCPYHRTMPRDVELSVLAWNESLFTCSELTEFLAEQSPDKVIRHIKKSDPSYSWAQSLINQE